MKKPTAREKRETLSIKADRYEQLRALAGRDVICIVKLRTVFEANDWMVDIEPLEARREREAKR